MMICILLLLGCRKNDEELDSDPDYSGSTRTHNHMHFVFDLKTTDDWALEVDASTLSSNLRFSNTLVFSDIWGNREEESFPLGNKGMIKLSATRHVYRSPFYEKDVFGTDLHIDWGSIVIGKPQSFDVHVYKNGKRFQSHRIVFIFSPVDRGKIDLDNIAKLKYFVHCTKLCVSNAENLDHLRRDPFIIYFKYPKVRDLGKYDRFNYISQLGCRGE